MHAGDGIVPELVLSTVYSIEITEEEARYTWAAVHLISQRSVQDLLPYP
jgi:hypothetical protein